MDYRKLYNVDSPSALRFVQRNKIGQICSLAFLLLDPLVNYLRQPHYILSRFLFAGQFVSLLFMMIPSKEQKLQYFGIFAHFEVFLALSIGSGVFLYVIMRQRAVRVNARRFWIALGLGIVSLFLGYYFALIQILGGIGLTEDGSGIAAVVSPLLRGDWKTFINEAATTNYGYLTFVGAIIYLSYISSWPLNDIFRRPGRRKRGLYGKIIDAGYEFVRKYVFRNAILPIEKMDIRLTNELLSLKYCFVRRAVTLLTLA